MIPRTTGCNETVGVYHLPPCASLATFYLFECKSEVRIEDAISSQHAAHPNFNTFLTILYIYSTLYIISTYII